MHQDSSHLFPPNGAHSHELFLGLVAPIGADLKLVVDLIKRTLGQFNYRPETIKISQLLRQCRYLDVRLPDTFDSEADRINAFMNAGNKLRGNTARGDALAILAVNNVGAIRQAAPEGRRAFIFDSLKHPEEVRTLRSVYGGNFFCFSVYSPRHMRINYLSRMIAKSCNDSNYEKYRDKAEILVERDAEEIENKFGQNVRETFSLGDAFVEIQQRNITQEQIDRIFKIMFRFPYNTPSKDEMGMFFARAVSLRSADLSRQVGAVITKNRGEVVAVGCNEVPRAGGGIVWEGETPDDRDFQKGHDANVEVRHWILAELYDKLSKAGWLSKEHSPTDAEEFVRQALYDEEKPILKHTRLAAIIEFGRIVHAEMHALIDAAKRGVPVDGCTMYTTTFPCHMCARHLIAAGLTRIVYIEPYPKSMALTLYEDSLSLGMGRSGWKGLVLDSFVGIAPRRFIELFEWGSRKDAYGNILPWVEAAAEPKVGSPLPTYMDAETAAALFLEEKGVAFGISTPHSSSQKVEDR